RCRSRLDQALTGPNGRDSKAKNQFAEISLPYSHESVRRRNGAKSIIGMPERSDQTIGKCVSGTRQKRKIFKIQWRGGQALHQSARKFTQTDNLAHKGIILYAESRNGIENIRCLTTNENRVTFRKIIMWEQDFESVHRGLSVTSW
ncbi:hypothetical protein, partial [Komagataeibacter europaeus]|uniref:hypothetical protein n=1 Tax=Komagataeibacter europaeus TaxID=33995 RepID=UPI0019553E69